MRNANDTEHKRDTEGRSRRKATVGFRLDARVLRFVENRLRLAEERGDKAGADAARREHERLIRKHLERVL